MWVKQALQDGVWVVGADIGDGDDRVNPLFMGGEAEFDGGGGYDLFDHKGAQPLMIQLLGQTGGCIVLGIQPYLGSDFIDRCGASPTIIVSCHLVCCMLKGSFCLFLHLRHLLGKVVHGFYSGTPQVGSKPICGCWPESSLNRVIWVVEWA